MSPTPDATLRHVFEALGIPEADAREQEQRCAGFFEALIEVTTVTVGCDEVAA